MKRGILNELSVVVPAFNEEQRLDATLPHLWRSLKRRCAVFEVIVVDDGSSDDTAGIVRRFSERHSEVRLIRYGVNRGKGYAVRTGVLEAKYDFVLFCDADLSTPVRELRKLLAALSNGYDVAIGSRASRDSKIIEHQPFYRMLMGKTFNKIVQILAVPGISDTQCGFKCFKRNVAREIFSKCRIDGFSFDVEVLYVARKMGFTVREIGVLWRNDPRSSVDPLWHSLQMLQELLAMRWFGLVGRYRGGDMIGSEVEA